MASCQLPSRRGRRPAKRYLCAHQVLRFALAPETCRRRSPVSPQPQSANLRLSVCCQKDICWLDIAVNDSFRMRGRERIRDLNRDIKQLFNVNGVSAYALFQALTFQLLHHNKGVPGVVLDLVNRANVGVIQLRRGTCFAHKTIERSWVIVELVRDELQGNVAAEL